MWCKLGRGAAATTRSAGGAALGRSRACGRSAFGSLVSTPIFYVNGTAHVGHLYSALLADSSARSRRMAGEAVVAATGTDEHGLKVHEAAVGAGLPELDFCTSVSKSFRDCFDEFGVGYDAFIRTTDPSHAATVDWLWSRLAARGYIYEGEHSGWYCKSDEAFLTDRQVGPGPAGGHVSLESGHSVEWLSEPNWLFRLSALRGPILEWLQRCPDVVQPASRRQEVLALLQAEAEAEGGGGDLSVSRPRRRVPWGIAAPDRVGGPAGGGAEPQTVYVWLDALSNYLTVAGGAPAVEAAEAAASRADGDTGDEGYRAVIGADGHVSAGPAVWALARGQQRGLSWDASPSQLAPLGSDPSGPRAPPLASGPWPTFAWPPAAHIVGKDIVRFHCVYWPAFLLAAGLALPKSVVVHGHFTAGQRKMSKSLGNVVCPQALVSGPPTVFADGAEWQPPVSAVRWYLAARGGLGSDGDFDTEDLRARWDKDVVGGVGNLFARLTGHALLPAGQLPDPAPGGLAAEDVALLGRVHAELSSVPAAFDACRTGAAATAISAAATHLNAFVSAQEPWLLVPGKPTQDSQRLAAVLWTALEGLRLVGTAMQPAVPEAAGKLLDALAVPADRRSWADMTPLLARPSGDESCAWRRPGLELHLAEASAASRKRPGTLLFDRSPAAPKGRRP